MKLAILTQYYPPEVGAPQARLSELALHFIRRGHSVTVLTAMPNYPAGRVQEGYGGLLRREQRDGGEVIRTFIYPTQKADVIKRMANYLSFVASSSVLGSAVLAPPDYLMVESPPLFLGAAGYWLSRFKGARLIFNVSDLWPESAVRLGMLVRGRTAHKMSTWFESFCYCSAWLVTGQSKEILEDITSRFPTCRTFHLSNGVDLDRFRQDRQTRAARAMMSDNGECIVLYAGLHGLAQGLDQVLNAAEALRAEPGLRFTLVGDGPHKQALVDTAAQRQLENIRFFDVRPASQMPEIVAAADIVLVTLKAHLPGAVPSKLYEAMASGRPVVLVADGEAAEIVRNHQAGIVVSPGDVDGLVQALKALRAQPALRITLGQNGRRAAEQSFDRAKIAAGFIKQLEDGLD